MKLIVQKTTRLSGEVTIPSSKSQCVRALLIATMAEGESVLHNFLDADDTQAAIAVCRGLGAEISFVGQRECHEHSSDYEKCLKVKSEGIPFKGFSGGVAGNVFNTGNSGITTRFLMPILGLRANSDDPVILDCGEQMKSRPIRSLIQALRNLGMKIEPLNKIELQNQLESAESQGQPADLPVRISGSLKGGKTEVDGITSQFLSALLLSCGCAKGESEITVSKADFPVCF